MDGTFLSGKYKGTILTVVVADANDQLLPVAFAIVESESTESWLWILSNVKQAVVQDRPDVCVISDRHQLSAGGKSIMFKDYAQDLIPGVDGTGASESKSALGTKRKWHHKFKPAKKAN